MTDRTKVKNVAEVAENQEKMDFFKTVNNSNESRRLAFRHSCKFIADFQKVEAGGRAGPRDLWRLTGGGRGGGGFLRSQSEPRMRNQRGGEVTLAEVPYSFFSSEGRELSVGVGMVGAHRHKTLTLKQTRLHLQLPWITKASDSGRHSPLGQLFEASRSARQEGPSTPPFPRRVCVSVTETLFAS